MVCYPCSGVIVSIVCDFSTNARNDNVFVWFYSGNCYNSVTRARNDKSVRNLLSLPPRGKVDCRSIAKARRMRGKRRYVFIRFYSPHSPLGSLRSAVSHRGRAGWRVFVSDISLPGDCHAAATPSLAMTMRNGCTLWYKIANPYKMPRTPI